MTIEEKAKAYDEALERVRVLGDGKHFVPYGMTVKEYIFPELRESEDEKIFREIYSIVNHCYQDRIDNLVSPERKKEQLDKWEKAKAWLEKQKEPLGGTFSSYEMAKTFTDGQNYVMKHPEKFGLQKPTEWNEKDENIRKQLISICDEWLGGGYSARPCLNDIKWLKNLLEKQKEQKPVDYDHEMWKNCEANFEGEKKEVIEHPEKYGLHKEQKPAEINEYEIIKKHITEDSLSSEVNKRLTECGWYVTDEKPAEWSEEDDWKRKELIQYLEEKGDYRTVWMTWLKSLSPPPHKEIYQAAKRDLAIKFMNYLDENRPEGKMSLSNGECEDIDKAFKENDWAKIMRYYEKYQPHWKPSEEQMRALIDIICFGKISYVGQEEELIALKNQLLKLM